MGLIDSMQAWFDGRQPRGSAPPCPPEADILKYKENHLPTKVRARLEQHFAACDDCRELLVLLARFPEEEIAEPPLSSAEIQQQTARVIQLIEEGDRRNPAPAVNGQSRRGPQLGWAYRFR